MKFKKYTLSTLLLLVFVLSNCSTDNKEVLQITKTEQDTIKHVKKLKENIDSLSPINKADTTSLIDIIKYFATKVDHYNINPTKDTLLRCKKGTIIYMPANILEHLDGSIPIGQVQISIKEYYTLSDFIGDNLSTRSGKRILETGGMININVQCNGKTLKIRNENAFGLYFPKRNQKNNMQLFYGEQNSNKQINWVLSSDTETAEPIQSNIIKQQSLPIAFSINRRTTSIDSVAVKWDMKNSDQTIFEYFSENFIGPKELKNKFSLKDYNVDLSITLDTSGKVNNIKFNKKSWPEFDKMVSDFFYAMEPLDISTMAKHSSIKEYSIGIDAHYSSNKEEFNKQFKEKYSSFKEEAISKIDEAELNYFVLTASKFGWINCDRFWDTPDEKIDFVVNSSSNIETKFFIVFKNIKSVMQSELKNNQVSFPNIPINQEVKVIGIRYSNGKPLMGIAETKTNKKGFELNAFEEFTITQLERELNKIN